MSYVCFTIANDSEGSGDFVGLKVEAGGGDSVDGGVVVEPSPPVGSLPKTEVSGEAEQPARTTKEKEKKKKREERDVMQMKTSRGHLYLRRRCNRSNESQTYPRARVSALV
jgi:hypothetical protein